MNYFISFLFFWVLFCCCFLFLPRTKNKKNKAHLGLVRSFFVRCPPGFSFPAKQIGISIIEFLSGFLCFHLQFAFRRSQHYRILKREGLSNCPFGNRKARKKAVRKINLNHSFYFFLNIRLFNNFYFPSRLKNIFVWRFFKIAIRSFNASNGLLDNERAWSTVKFITKIDRGKYYTNAA